MTTDPAASTTTEGAEGKKEGCAITAIDADAADITIVGEAASTATAAATVIADDLAVVASEKSVGDNSEPCSPNDAEGDKDPGAVDVLLLASDEATNNELMQLGQQPQQQQPPREEAEAKTTEKLSIDEADCRAVPPPQEAADDGQFSGFPQKVRPVLSFAGSADPAVGGVVVVRTKNYPCRFFVLTDQTLFSCTHTHPPPFPPAVFLFSILSSWRSYQTTSIPTLLAGCPTGRAS